MPPLPMSVTDWKEIAETKHPGETGFALWKTQNFGEIRVRMIEYSPGYAADHWCAKGHIVYVLAGDLVIEHDDGRRFPLSAGMTWHAPDEAGPPHRVVCAAGATVFIVD